MSRILINFSDRAVGNVTEPGDYSFGEGYFGLFLRAKVTRDGSLSKTWLQRVNVRGLGEGGGSKRRELGLGKYPLVGVGAVRTTAEENASLAMGGGDPLAEMEVEEVPVLRDVALEVISKNSKPAGEGKKARWTKETAKCFRRAFRRCEPNIGDKPVDQISRKDLGFIIEMQANNPTDAQLLVLLLSKVFNYCVFMEHIAYSPVDESFKAQLEKVPRGPHFAALLERDLPDAFAQVEAIEDKDIAILSCVLAIMLTGVRSHSAYKAEWSEFQWKEIRDISDWDEQGWEPVDLDQVEGSTKTILWRIPVGHMKMGKSFDVPVSRQFFQILRRMWAMRGVDGRDPDKVFPSVRKSSKTGHIGRGGMHNILQGLGFASDTVGSPPTLHGLRATLRTWAKKRGVPDLVAEAVLAHESSDSYKGAYQRWNMLELRAQLMQAYGDHATGELVEGWEWIEPAAQAKLDAERRRTEKAERRAEEAERRAVQAERRAVREEQRGDRLEVELAEVRREVGKTNELVQRLVEQVAAGGFGLKSGESVAVKSP